jgi:hypothetical protein
METQLNENSQEISLKNIHVTSQKLTHFSNCKC